MRFRLLLVVLALVIGFETHALCAQEPASMVNSIGMSLVRIESGTFEMGVDSVPLPKELTAGPFGVIYGRATQDGDYDETPVHRVTISRPFLISETEVTVEQFRRFKPDYAGSSYGAPYAAGVSWDDATAFCRWLSEVEGKPYRLPTEAEWEYACRAGTRSPFSSGAEPPSPESSNPWGVKNMHTNVAEWCLDWHGRYSAEPQTDPVGPSSGIARVVRGGGLDFRERKEHPSKFYPAEMAYYRRSANRAGMAPGFASAHGNIGFRVVQAEMPATSHANVEQLWFQTAIKRNKPDLKSGPDPSRPLYRTREMFPDLAGQNMRSVGWKIGLPPALGSAYHNSALALCDNGDLVAAYYNTLEHENDPDQTVLSMRLRHGAEEWDMPEPWPDFPDAADAAPLFWNDGSRLWMFFGSPRLLGGPPFVYMTSTDNGATWSPVRIPDLRGPVGEFTAQPVNSAFRDRDGTIYLAVDGEGPTTALFASRDDGKTWFDTVGRSGGRHTTFVPGTDGSILGFGGKDSNIDGFMPLSITRDGGKTYETSPTQFTPLGGGQRPSVIRLASGRLFFVADAHGSRVLPRQWGSFVALSDDEGRTWTRRELPGVRTVGYVTAIQAPNGVIHVVTSKTSPHLHIELNETWILQGGDPAPRESAIRDIKSYRETYPDGRPRVEYEAGVDADGCLRLHGTQTFYHPDGKLLWRANFVAGRRVGEETIWSADGKVHSERLHRDDGGWTWRVFDGTGRLQAESTWRGKRLESHRIP